jgi:hypothetical protein
MTLAWAGCLVPVPGDGVIIMMDDSRTWLFVWLGNLHPGFLTVTGVTAATKEIVATQVGCGLSTKITSRTQKGTQVSCKFPIALSDLDQNRNQLTNFNKAPQYKIP